MQSRAELAECSTFKDRPLPGSRIGGRALARREILNPTLMNPHSSTPLTTPIREAAERLGVTIHELAAAAEIPASTLSLAWRGILPLSDDRALRVREVLEREGAIRAARGTL